MGITIRSLGDTEFDKEFMKQIPALEQQMSAHDLDPSDFVIEKTIASTLPLPMLFATGPVPAVSYDYQVTVQTNSFKVTLPGDASFFEYFSKLCFSPDEDDSAKKPETLLTKVEKWFEKDPIKE